MPQPWIALVGPEIEENLSLRYLASSLAQAGFTSEIIAFNAAADLPEVLERITSVPTPPLLIGLSLAFQWRAPDFLGLAVALREAGYRGHITAGGHFATFQCREIVREFPEFDSVVRQEAEGTIVALARALQAGTPWQGIAGLAFRSGAEVVLTDHPELPDLTKLPRPDRRGEPAACFGHPIAPLVSTRGCYANCSFCCIAAWHEESLPGKRYRERPLDDVADEMVEMQRTRGIEIFVFHDDNFFLPGWRKNLERFHALADALEKKGIGHFATVVKARPTDVHPEVFRVLRDRLKCIRTYVGIETDSDQGLVTLKRWARPKHNRVAMDVIEDLGLYACFNMLVFDPDTTIESLETNLAFMDAHAEHPFNFGRTELYAGTPLLARMQQENRARGDWLQWDYSLRDEKIERVFTMAARAFHVRNFAPHALANAIMGTRFDIEVARHFHPEAYDPAWRDEGRALSRALGKDSVRGLREIVARATDPKSKEGEDVIFAERLGMRLGAFEDSLRGRASALAASIGRAIGRTGALTEQGDKVATSLQRAVAEVA